MTRVDTAGPCSGRRGLPVTKVDHIVAEKGVSVAKRGDGTPVGEGTIAFLRDVKVSGEGLEKTVDAISAGLGFLTRYEEAASTAVELTVGRTVVAEFLQGHDRVMDAMPGETPTIRFDTDTPEEVEEGLDALYGIGLLHELHHLSGLDERDALDRTLTFYEGLNDADKDALHRVLSSPKLDTGGVFLRFLESGAGKDAEEKGRLIAWVLARTSIELPYNSRRVRRALREETDLASLRARVHNDVVGTYVEELDSAHCERIADLCLERGQRLVGGRFSRAFYIDAMLMASAKVFPARYLGETATDLEVLVKGLSIAFESEDLRDRRISFDTIGGELQTIVNLIGKDMISNAEIEGAIGKLKTALREFETSALTQLDEVQTSRSRQIAAERRATEGMGETWEQLTRDRSEVRGKVDQVLGSIAAVEGAAAEAPKMDPTFMVFFQALLPLYTIQLGLVNELEDPFFGEDEEVHRLIRECGPNMYVTANLRAWLRKCDDWVEALPAYASYEIVPREGGAYDVQASVWRGIMEDMYRRHAEDWALNIEEVMALEHVALARDIVADTAEYREEVDRVASEEHLGREEAVRAVLRRDEERTGTSRRIADVAALVDATYDALCVEVAERREREDLGRMEALRSELVENTSEKNLVRAALTGDDVAKSARSLVEREGLTEGADELKTLALKRRRDLPSIHVLTTLGPGETEINVLNWLEESMGLFNVSRAYGLEDQVQKRTEEYEARLIAVGGRLVDELDLEGDLFNLMHEEGLRVEEDEDRRRGVLRLLAAYPEVSSEAAKLCLLIEHEEHHGRRNRDPENAAESQNVTEYLASHPELEAQAIEEVIRTNELEHDVLECAEKHAADEVEARRAVVEGNPDCAAEKASTERSLARGKVLVEVGLAGEVGTYIRQRLDRTLAGVIARREVISEHGLAADLNAPRFRYDATGPFKKYNILYTPSRVDLGAEEVVSVRNVPKWLGGLDRDAARSGKALYSLYNVAGPTAVDSPRLAEFLKVGENFFSRGGVFYLSLAAGTNLDALGIGDFEFFRDQWNMRGDRIVLPGGETYGGFCVPKEFSLLYAIIIAAVNPRTSGEMLNAFSVPAELHQEIIADLRHLLALRLSHPDPLTWEEETRRFLGKRYPEYFDALGGPAYVSRLPQLSRTMEMAGVLAAQDEEDRQLGFQLAYWTDKKAQGLEEINRVGPFRKVHLIRQLVRECRRRNPEVAPDEKLIGVMTASYKEGERKGGREVPISDVRFSAGSRKMEIYAGVAEHHILNDIDPEGREIVGRMYEDFRSPSDVRMVGTCTGADVLNHVPGSGLEGIKDDVYRQLTEAGLDDNIIGTNCTVYGGDLELWSGIKEMPESPRRSLIEEIGPKIHLLVLDQRGVYRTYEEAIQGVDFVDLGIPDPELLDLIDDLPKMLYLMRKGRPESALVFADSTSGARRRAFSYRYASSRRKVKELFALDDRAVYGSLGLGREMGESWRQEMIAEREGAEALHNALIEARYDDARRIYGRIVNRVVRDAKAEEAAEDEIKARKFGVLTKDYRYVSEAFGRVKRGLALHQLDFGTWLILGGMYVLNGKVDAEKIPERRGAFERALAGVPSAEERVSDLFTDQEVDAIVRAFVTPRYVPPPEEMYREVETGIAGSLKAVEEKAARLEKRQARRRQARRAGALRERSRAFAAMEAEVVKEGAFGRAYEEANALLGYGKEEISQETFGKLQAWTRAAFDILMDHVIPGTSELRSLAREEADTLFSGGEIDPDGYRSLAEHTARLAEEAGGDRDVLEQIAMALELLDIALIVENTQDPEDPEDLMIQIARFFDVTLNNHVFDYVPYHYHRQRGAGFEEYDRQEKFELAMRRHRWLYTYVRHQMVTGTALATCEPAYQDAWIGDADRDLLPLAVNAQDPAQRFWFSYVRLRDASVLVHEGYPLPEVFGDLDPSALRCDERTNVVIVYPHGNTTVPVAMEQGAKLSEQENVNLMLCAFPSIVDDSRYGCKVLQAPDGLMYVSREDYRHALLASGMGQEEVDARARSVGEEGVLIAASFSRSIVAHGIFFHFTHPLRPDIETVRAPLIQPFVWEAATHLKCRLPEMLKGSGIRTADQINWYHDRSAEMSERDAKTEIERRLIEFSGTHDTLIVKPEKESGGRQAKILPVQADGQVLAGNIAELSDLAYDISKTDNAVIQDVLKSRVRQLYTRAFQEDLVDRFTRIGVPVLLDRDPRTPLFSYFRQVVVLGERGYEISHHITVLSTQGIANVGQGGLLYEYTDDIIHPKYREDLRREMTKAALDSMESQRAYIKAHWREILEEYLAAHPEYRDEVRIELGEDLLGFSYSDIPYEMGDYMPVFLVDGEDNLVQVYDPDGETFLPLYDRDGNPTDVQVYDESGGPVPKKPGIPMFDASGDRIRRFDAKGREIPTLVVLKIEPNPGAGLWRPHNDQLPPERKGEGVFILFECLGQRAALYRGKLRELANGPVEEASSGTAVYLSSTVMGAEDVSDSSGGEADPVSVAMRRAKEELGG